MILKDILYKVSIRSVKGDTDAVINQLQIDSRKVNSGDCFIAIKGAATDGHQYINTALNNGAVVIVCEELPVSFVENVTYIQVENSAIAAGFISHNFYGEPSLKLKLVGVTGTNGKTTVATILWKLFAALGYKCGLISTVQNQIGEQIIPSTHIYTLTQQTISTKW